MGAPSLYAMRRAKNLAAQSLAILATVFGLFWLVWIMWTTLANGMASINLDLFTRMTPRPGSEGGLLNAFVGSAIVSLLGIAIGAPVGVLAGTFLSEYANRSWARPLGETVRFVNDILLSAPDRKSTRLNSSHVKSSYAVFSLKKNRFKVNS